MPRSRKVTVQNKPLFRAENIKKTEGSSLVTRVEQTTETTLQFCSAAPLQDDPILLATFRISVFTNYYFFLKRADAILNSPKFVNLFKIKIHF